MGYPNWIERINNTLAEDIRTRTVGETTLEGLLGVADLAGRSLTGNLGDFQARAVAPEKSLLAVFGIPDDANGSFYDRFGAYTSAASLKNSIDAFMADLGDGSALDLGSITGALGNPATDTFTAVIGQLLDAALATNVASDGTQTEVTLLRTILDRIGQTPAAADDAIHTIIGQRDAAALGKNADDTGAESEIALLRSLIDRIGNVGASDIDGLLDTLTADVTGATGIFHEQEDTPVNITAIAGSETIVLNLIVASTRYRVLSLRLKAADPSTETITVRLYELINDVPTVVDTFSIDAANWGTYHSLMDMFGLPHLAGDNLKVTVQVSGGAGVAITGQYSHSKTNV